MTKIKISIPQLCHENWDGMTSVEKGKFCNSCQKNVFDFTTASDRDIVTAFKNNKNLCGRFLNSQLDRDLTKPEKKNHFWIAATTAVISTLGFNELTAQEKAPIEQTDNRALGKFMVSEPSEIANAEVEVSGVVTDTGGPIPGANIFIKGTTKTVQTDFDGKFTIKAKINDVITVSFTGFEDYQFTITQSAEYNNIILKELPDKSETVILGYVVQKSKK